MGFLPLEIPASHDHQKNPLFRQAEGKSYHFEIDLCFMEGALAYLPRAAMLASPDPREGYLARSSRSSFPVSQELRQEA